MPLAINMTIKTNIFSYSVIIGISPYPMVVIVYIAQYKHVIYLDDKSLSIKYKFYDEKNIYKFIIYHL